MLHIWQLMDYDLGYLESASPQEWTLEFRAVMWCAGTH